MKLHHFIDSLDLKMGQLTIANGDIIRQVKDVLKLKPEEKIVICDGRGKMAEAEIVELNKKGMQIFVSEVVTPGTDAENDVTLYCSILKRENFELAVQKAVEVGVNAIVPLITQRTVKTGLNQKRLEKVVREAAEQSERAFLPLIGEPTDWQQAMESALAHDLNIFFHPIGKSAADLPRLKKSSSIGVFIGPEGGWSEAELKDVQEKGMQVVSLGKTVLRGETAATVGSYLAAYIK